jgi:hypothetical protein
MNRKPVQPKPNASLFKPFSIFGGLVILTFISAFATLIIAIGYLTQPEPTAGPLAFPATPTLEQAPAIALLTQDCPPLELVLGERSFRVEKVTLDADGSLPEPPASADTAYWVTTGGTEHVLLLGAAAFGQDSEALQDLSQATFIHEACHIAIYELAPARPSTASASEIIYTASQGLDLFIQTNPAGYGYLLQGQLLQEFISVQGQQPSAKAPSIATPSDSLNPTDTPSSAFLDSQPLVQAEVGLMEAAGAPDGRSLQVKVFVYNFGEYPITFSMTDVRLEGSSAGPLSPAQVVPELPHTIRAGQTSTFTFTFNNPPPGWGTLRVLTTQFELADFLP